MIPAATPAAEAASARAPDAGWLTGGADACADPCACPFDPFDPALEPVPAVPEVPEPASSAMPCEGAGSSRSRAMPEADSAGGV